MGDRLATIDMGRKVGAAVTLPVAEELGPHQKRCRLGRGLPLYGTEVPSGILIHLAILPQQTCWT